ncbi:MAG: hypothetical protein MUO26_11765 [Methanotrichaceae archaeon]|nr:hypothetical protein [Methanotrichaceae archaeon]
MASLFQDNHKLKGGEATSDFQFCKPPMKPTKYARKVACDIENLESL